MLYLPTFYWKSFFFIKVYEVLITFRKRGFAAYGIYTAGKTFLIFLRENILIKFFHNIFTGISSCRGNFFSKTYAITLFFFYFPSKLHVLILILAEDDNNIELNFICICW